MKLSPFSSRNADTGTSPRKVDRARPPQVGPVTEGVPLAAIIPRKFTEDAELVMVHRPKDAMAERYRRLRSKLELARNDAGNPARTILVTSSVPDEGKTTTALNLALAFAEERQRSTLIVDLDLRRPSVGRYVTPPASLGLSELLNEPVGLDHVLLQMKSTRLSILPAGRPAGNPTELLRSDALAGTMEELRKRFDWIVIDTPPCVPFSDASVLQALADGTVLVVRAGRTAKGSVERALESLEGGPILGVVLNDVVPTPVDRYYYRYDDYDPYRYAEGGEEKSK